MMLLAIALTFIEYLLHPGTVLAAVDGFLSLRTSLEFGITSLCTDKKRKL